jgi:hypothetical protein
MKIPNWAISLGTIFRHQIVKDGSLYCWRRNKSLGHVTIDWVKLQDSVLNKRTPMWDYVKFCMDCGLNLERFRASFTLFLAKDFYLAAHPDEDVIDYLIRTDGGRNL